jgi:L-alanine-DL-glutamate epimerase-like enolase superfamily enzyme
VAGVSVQRLAVGAYTVPTATPESDGTLEWHSTTIVVVEVEAGGRQGIGFTYGAAAGAALIHDQLRPVVEGGDAMAIPGLWQAMVRTVRNAGRPGVLPS